MIFLLYGVLCLTVFGIAYEDFRFRQIRVLFFAIFFVSLFLLLIITWPLSVLIHNTLVNLLFMSIQIASLQIYFWVKEKRWSWIFDRKLGWGDVVFWLCILPVWPLMPFVLFLVSSLIFSLLCYTLIFRKKHATIPLAGLQALFFLLIFMSERLSTFSLERLMNQLVPSLH